MTVYAIHFTKFKITSFAIPKPSAFYKIQTATVIFTKTSKQGSDVSPVNTDDLFENVTWSK